MKTNENKLLVGASICVKANGRIEGHCFEDDGGGLLGGDLAHSWRIDPASGLLLVDGEACKIQVSPESRNLTISPSGPNRDLECRDLSGPWTRCAPGDVEAKLCGRQ